MKLKKYKRKLIYEPVRVTNDQSNFWPVLRFCNI